VSQGDSRAPGNELALWIVPLVGGSPRRLGDVFAHTASWSPDGERIACGVGQDLRIVQADGTGGRTVRGGQGSVRSISWSPDSTRLRFDTAGERASIREARVDGKESSPLFPDRANSPGEYVGAWTPHGSYFLFGTARPSGRGISAIREQSVWLYRSSSEPVELATGPVSVTAFVFSKDGKKIFSLAGPPLRVGELIRYDLKTERFTPYLGGISADQLAFSRDAQWVCYVSFPERNLWRCKSDGSQRLQLTFSPLRVLNPRWSPDGRRIAFSGQIPGSVWNIYLVPIEGGQPEHVLPEARSQADVAWSPDGGSLAFGEPGAESGKRSIEILDLSSRNVSVLPDSMGLFAPRWSPNGRYIAALHATSRGLRVFDWTSRSWTELGAGVTMGWPDWSHDSLSIYFLELNSGSVGRVDIDTRKVSKIVSLQGVRTVGGWGGSAGWYLGLAPDDSPLLLRDAGSSEIYAFDWKAP